jgi:outer membrane protein
MKHTIILAAVLASGFALNATAQTSAASAAAPAATPAAAPVAKVAVIAFQAAVAQTNEGQRTLADVQKKFAPKQTQLKALNDEIENLKKQLQAQGDKLSEAEAASRAKVIDDKTKQLQRSAEDARNDYQQEMGTALNTVATKVFDVVDSYSKEHGYTLVVDVGEQQSPVLWAADSTNITMPIIAAYNTKSGVPAPAALPAAPAPASKPAAPGAAPKN